MDPLSPARITVANDSGIRVTAYQAQPLGLGIHIDHLIITGNGGMTSQGQITAGIFIYHDAPGDIVGAYISNVNISGFMYAGLYTSRGNTSRQTGAIR